MPQQSEHPPLVAQQFLSSLRNLPLWVKQVLYVELGDALKVHFSTETLNALNPRDTLAFYVPQLSERLEGTVIRENDDIGLLLSDVQHKLTILDICLRRGWSLETICNYIYECIESDSLLAPDSPKAMGSIEYLANRIRLGEYLVKMGTITSDQLDQALRTQQYIKEALQENTGLANILINLGYISKRDTEGILFLKEESRMPLKGLDFINRVSGSSS